MVPKKQIEHSRVLASLWNVLIMLYLLNGTLWAQAIQQQDPAAVFKVADALYNADEPTEASDRKAMLLFREIGTNSQAPDALRIESYLKVGNILMGQQQYDSCHLFYHLVLQLNQKTLRKAAYYYESWLFLGTSMYYSGTLDSARYYFEKAALIAEKYKEAQVLPEQDRLYNSLGVLYFEGANYLQAKNHFVTALRNVSPRAEDKQEFYTTIQSNIANCLLKLKQYDSAIIIFKQLRPVPAQKQISAQNLANAYFEKGDLAEAQDIYQNLLAKDAHLSATALNNLGRIYTVAQRWNEASATFLQALNINQEKRGTLKTKERALTYLYMSELSQKMGLPEEAIDYTNQALTEVFFNFVPIAKGDLPFDITDNVSPITAFQILIAKARLLSMRYRHHKSFQTLWTTHRTYLKALEVLNYISRKLDNDEARLFFLDNANAVFDEAIRIAYLMYKENRMYAEDFVFILESYKGSIVKNNLAQRQLRATKKIPEAWLVKEKQLKELYAVYLTRLGTTNAPDAQKKLQDRISLLQVELAQVQRSMQGVINTSQQEAAKEFISLPGIQNNLPANFAIINYYISQTGIYIMAIGHTKVILKHITTGTEFQNALQVFSAANKTQHNGERYAGYSAAHVLYNYLVQPVEDLVKKTNHLIFVPDGFLFQLSFEALIEKPHEKKYLLLDKTISYQYSMQLLLQPHEKERSGNSIFAMAPFAQRGYVPAAADTVMHLLAPLPFTQQEIDQPFAYKLLDAEATKRAFLKNYTRYSILHLATHASLGIDSNNNWIQFFPRPQQVSTDADKLYVEEIYNLELDLKPLVILSACESANGTVINGEGLLSLSRAFIYAGAGGVISTLYKTDDLVTAVLIQRLYYHLQKGKEPGVALRLAKIDFLNADTISPRLKTPGYWSNFVYTGFQLPAKKQDRDSRFILLSIGMLIWGLAGIVFLTLHFRQQKVK